MRHQYKITKNGKTLMDMAAKAGWPDWLDEEGKGERALLARKLKSIDVASEDGIFSYHDFQELRETAGLEPFQMCLLEDKELIEEVKEGEGEEEEEPLSIMEEAEKLIHEDSIEQQMKDIREELGPYEPGGIKSMKLPPRELLKRYFKVRKEWRKIIGSRGLFG